MMRKFMKDGSRASDKLLPGLLFVVQEVSQASMGFSPFELLYGRQHWGILDLLTEIWEEQETRMLGSVQYTLQLQEQLLMLDTWPKTTERSAAHSRELVQQRDEDVNLRIREPGPAIVALPRVQLLAKWQGPFMVTRWVGPNNYKVRLLGHQREMQVYHVNLLKAWKAQEDLMIIPYLPEPELGLWDNEPQAGDHWRRTLTLSNRTRHDD